jgi:hypothetical protein
MAVVLLQKTTPTHFLIFFQKKKGKRQLALSVSTLIDSYQYEIEFRSVQQCCVSCG